ncbi:hypothetical protein QAD02_005237 [Eretmocerus hayati]|uniref:Uncharacterized protein n=1 Tax=Eretmocerus hayati TaxID=131215 RepID=A0ACC2NRT0_9HYME|nr:hypothetical protein QAD02_005237 [Eretmocerus hayati]
MKCVFEIPVRCTTATKTKAGSTTSNEPDSNTTDNKSKAVSDSIKSSQKNVLERGTHARDGSQKFLLTFTLKIRILDLTRQYGTSRDTPRRTALATSDHTMKPDDMDLGDSTKFYTYEEDLTLVGVVGMLDPPRKEVFDSLVRCRGAGIRVFVTTGDNKATTEAICRRVGVFGGDEDTTGKSYSGREFDNLPLFLTKSCLCQR